SRSHRDRWWRPSPHPTPDSPARVLPNTPAPSGIAAPLSATALVELDSVGWRWLLRSFRQRPGSVLPPDRPLNTAARSPRTLLETHPTGETVHAGSWRRWNGRESLARNPAA